MSLSVGIVGLPNVGKSTLFNALLKKQQAYAANFPFATIEPNVGIVPVPDPRLQKLAETVAAARDHANEASVSRGGRERASLSVNPDIGNESFSQTKLPPLVPATIRFVDIAGLVKGASEGEGLGNKFLSHIRETDVICLVIRAFNDPNVVVTGSGERKTDLEIVKTELILADLQTAAKQDAPKGKVTPELLKRWQVIQRIQIGLNEGKLAREIVSDDEERYLVSDLSLLTMKPILYVLNVGESELAGLTVDQLIDTYAKQLNVPQQDVVVISAKVEAELGALNEQEQREFLHGLGLSESSLERLIKASYQKLGLASFLTAGELECRAWTIRQGMKAVDASGVIHTDFVKKFIKADVINWETFVEAGGWKNAREKGLVRSEGRDYAMQDGDVVEFRIGA